MYDPFVLPIFVLVLTMGIEGLVLVVFVVPVAVVVFVVSAVATAVVVVVWPLSAPLSSSILFSMQKRTGRGPKKFMPCWSAAGTRRIPA